MNALTKPLLTVALVLLTACAVDDVVGDGGPCGSGDVCADGLSCIAVAPDARGGSRQCRAPCETTADCPRERFCSTSVGACLPVGGCANAFDCAAAENTWFHADCDGVASCSEGDCVWSCAGDPCEDLASVDFGPCDEPLGFGVVSGQCVQIVGCDVLGGDVFFVDGRDCELTCGLAEEVCDNGVDDNADGSVDCADQQCFGKGGCPDCHVGSFCSDDNPCTTDDFCDDGVCTGQPVVCDPGESCVRGECIRCESDADCDDDNICTDDVCNADGTCSFSDNIVACDDGQPCTHSDVCADGRCSGVDYACGEGDCAGVCDGAGGCMYPPTGACDDGDLCTYDDRCTAGSCAGTPIVCSPGSGVCALGSQCDGSATCAELRPGAETACDDGDACTHSDVCDGNGGCSGTSYGCNDGNPCTDDVCDGAGGCNHPANSADCNDSNPCTTGDQCSGGTCRGNPLPNGHQFGLADERCCNGIPVNIGTDEANCGGCGISCDAGFVCEPVEQTSCTADVVNVSGRCTCNYALGNGSCPSGQICRNSGWSNGNRCGPPSASTCSANQSAIDVTGCPDYCRY